MERYNFLDSIHLGFVPDKDFYLKIWGFDLSYPGFRDLALNELNRIGCHDAWRKYAEYVTEYETDQSAMFKKIAEELLEEEESDDARYAEVG